MTNFEALWLTLGIMFSFGFIVAGIAYYFIARDEGWFERRR